MLIMYQSIYSINSKEIAKSRNTKKNTELLIYTLYHLTKYGLWRYTDGGRRYRLTAFKEKTHALFYLFVHRAHGLSFVHIQ
jgi:uncharacterized protein (DUF1684 family)